MEIGSVHSSQKVDILLPDGQIFEKTACNHLKNSSIASSLASKDSSKETTQNKLYALIYSPCSFLLKVCFSLYKKVAEGIVGVLKACISIYQKVVSKDENKNLSSYDVCDTSLIYDKSGSGFEYSLPKKILEEFLSGVGFDNQTPYTAAELENLKMDIREIFQNILKRQPEKREIAVITAGAPGSGKTTKMRQELGERKVAYICPDDVCLKNQVRTWKSDIDKGNGSKESHQAAYNKWRPGSNAAAHFVLAHLIREKYSFYFGSTSSGPATGKFFEFLKKQGYQIKLIHVVAPDDVRWQSILKRDQTFVQTTEQDVKEKGLLLPQRIMDTYLKYADEIDFCYRDGVEKDAELAATWTRNPPSSDTLGVLKIISMPLYDQIKEIHNAAAKSLQRPDLLWEASLEKNSKIS